MHVFSEVPLIEESYYSQAKLWPDLRVLLQTAVTSVSSVYRDAWHFSDSQKLTFITVLFHILREGLVF